MGTQITNTECKVFYRMEKFGGKTPIDGVAEEPMPGAQEEVAGESVSGIRVHKPVCVVVFIFVAIVVTYPSPVSMVMEELGREDWNGAFDSEFFRNQPL